MGEALVNRELTVRYPDGFREMSASELRRAYRSDAGRIWGIWDKKLHVIIAVFWHKPSAIGRALGLIVNNRELAVRVEKGLRDSYGDSVFSSKGYHSTELGGESAEGFRYEYSVDGIAQEGCALVTRHEGCTYTVYGYARKGSAEGLAAIDEIIGAMSFA